MERYVVKEDGGGREDFCQLYRTSDRLVFPDELGVGAVAQGLLVAPERKRTVKIPAGTPAKPRLEQKRQSRISVALAMDDPKFAYKPAESGYPDVGVRFDRENAASSLAGRSLGSRPTLSTARRRQTTIPLSGQPPLEPTHRLIDLKVPFETVAIALSQPLSADKLTALTNGNSLAFPASRNYYQELLAKRTEAERLAAEIGTNPSENLLPEIPW